MRFVATVQFVFSLMNKLKYEQFLFASKEAFMRAGWGESVALKYKWPACGLNSL